MTRQTYSLEEIKDMLLAQVDQVVHVYAPPVAGSYEDKGRYFTLNPGRADRSVGSFYVWVSGPKAGKWADFATGEHGDILDLIRLNQNCSLADALKEARAFLGLESESPADRRRREKAAAEAKARRAEAARSQREAASRRARQAQALWLSGQQHISRTPVEAYLRDTRGIDLRALGRQPRAIRYVPHCFYQDVDPETGEVIEVDMPAMVAIVTDAKGNSVACHRTYLGINPVSGRWDKAAVRQPKKVLGDYAGASIHLWSGTGPRGGKGGPLAKAAEGSGVYIAEGIEDALSCAMVLPEVRVLSAISLSNMGRVALPPAVTGVTLIADQDENDQARQALNRAIEAHRKEGRTVRLWQNRHGGKDLNDALRQARQEGQHGAEQRAG